MALTAAMATGVRSVISMAGRPPATSARASGTACATSSITTTGMTGRMLSGSGRLDSRDLLVDGTEHASARLRTADGRPEGGEQLPAGARGVRAVQIGRAHV